MRSARKKPVLLPGLPAEASRMGLPPDINSRNLAEFCAQSAFGLPNFMEASHMPRTHNRTADHGHLRRDTFEGLVRRLLEELSGMSLTGAALYSDALKSYDGLAGDYAHQVVDHATQYVDGRVHTNGLNNLWSLLKRGISGTYVSVEPFSKI